MAVTLEAPLPHYRTRTWDLSAEIEHLRKTLAKIEVLPSFTNAEALCRASRLVRLALDLESSPLGSHTPSHLQQKQEALGLLDLALAQREAVLENLAGEESQMAKLFFQNIAKRRKQLAD